MNLLFSLLFAAATLGTPPADGMPHGRRGVFALTNARVVTVTGGTLERGTVVIRGGTIEAVGAAVAVPADAEVIDCTGLTVYPGLIDSGSGLGLTEVGSLSETRDGDDIGEIIPHFRALTAVNPNSVAIPVTRVEGVTTVLTQPGGGLFPGTAALVNLYGYTPEQMLVGDAQMVVLEFPQTGRRGSFDRRTDEDIEKAATKALAKLNDTWDAALLHARIDSAYRAQPEQGRARPYVPAMDALAQVVRGERKLMIEVNSARDIRKALEWIESRNLKGNVVLSGVLEGWRVAGEIAAAGVPVLAGPVLTIPTRSSDRYDKAYANPGLLAAAGVQVAIRSGETENTRNLPFHAGFAVAYGMDREAALRAVTIEPARIFGVADQVGSLEAGKMANVIVTTGDPFETRTQVRHVFINGYLVPMESRQTRLYEEFLQREPGYTGEPTLR